MKNERSLNVALFMLLLAFSTAFGQTTEYSKNTADQTLRSNGRVNPSSLGLEMDVPLGAYPGRGINLPLGLSYSSKQWRFEEKASVLLYNGTSNVQVIPRFSENAAGGWSSSLQQPYIEYTDEIHRFDNNGNVRPEIVSPGSYDPGGDNYVKRVTVYLPGGASHELRAQDAPTALIGGMSPTEASWDAVYYSVDGSGLKYVQDSTTSPATYKLLMTDGSYYDFNATRENKNSVTTYIQVRRANRLTDVHGNYVQFNAPTTSYPNGSVTDQLNRTFPVMVPRETPVLTAQEPMLEQTFTMPGMDASYVLRWKRLKWSSAETSAFTEFMSQELHYTGNASSSQSGGFSPYLFTTMLTMSCSNNHLVTLTDGQFFNPVLLTEIELPNGASYKFSYNEFGEIEKITYPTGGREEIEHEQVASLAQMSTPYQISNRGVTSREVYESDSDSTPDTWTYTAASSRNNFRTSTIAPDGTQTDRFMHRGTPEPACNVGGSNPWDPLLAKQNRYGRKWGYDNILAGMAYEERSFSSSGALMQRTLTRWTASNTATVMTMEPLRYAQRNARTLSTESIVYDGNAGLSTATTMDYEMGADQPGSPLNVIKTTQYAFKVVSGGSGYSPATATQAPPTDVVDVGDPTINGTPVRINEMVFLQSDGDYSQTIKDAYAAKNLIKLPTKTFVKDGTGTVIASQGEIKYDETGYGESYRGRPTTARSWLDTNSSWLETRMTYDVYGNSVAATDARGNTTTTVFDSTYHHAFPISVTSAVPSDGTYGSNTAFSTTTTYNSVTGQPLTTTDPNGVETRIEYEDPLLRPTRVASYHNNVQVGAATETYYGAGTDLSSTRWVKTRSQIDATNWKEGYSWFDGLGRTIRSQSVDSDGDVFSLTCYDNMGRAWKGSNPFRGYTTQDCTTTTGVEWTVNTFDTAGRPWKTTTPDGAVATTTYGIAATSGNLGTAVTVEDQAGKLRRSITNGLGHLTRVDEPNNSEDLGTIDAPNQPTFYSYDFLNNLTQVQQSGDNNEECGPSTTTCSQTRTFQHDSLSRLKQATNPESGTILYTYDANGNLQTKKDPRDIVTTYSYDALNRVKTRVYTDEPTGSETPDVSYYYDNITNAKGKLIKVSTSLSTTEYVTFDILGRVTRSKQTTDGVVYGDDANPMTYSYNLSGALTEQQYPSGRVVKNILDADGDLATVQGKKNANHAYWNYANHFSYNAAGALTSMQLGNGRWEATTFNNRLQPTQISLGKTQNATDLLKLDYQYGDLDGSGAVITGSNNGNVAKQTITVQSVGGTPGFTAVQNYDYDSLNRIQIASETLVPTTGAPETWTQQFKYDRYGNKNFVTTGGSATTTLGTCPTEVCNPTISPNSNKITSTGYSFDAGGNTIRDAENRKFTYDAENMQVTVESVAGQTVTGIVGEYWYDGEGKRTKKRAYQNNILLKETVFVYDAAGKMIGEYSNDVASLHAKVVYLTADHLGSPRVNTNVNGNITARRDYHPFGDEISSTQRTSIPGYADNTVRKQFTGKERDHESKLENFLARYYRFDQGRFISPDPILISDSRILSPQSWNSYTYVSNNPLAFVDPTGMEKVRLGQHTDQEIAKRQREINSEMQSDSISEERRAEVSRESATLEIEREGNRVVGNALTYLDSIGERQGLELSDFTTTTNSSSDFRDDSRIKGDPGAGSGNAMFVLEGSGDTQIYVNSNAITYQHARGRPTIPGYHQEDATRILSTIATHERSHRDSATKEDRLSEHKAYTEQLRVLRKYGPDAFVNKPTYERTREVLCTRTAQQTNC